MDLRNWLRPPRHVLAIFVVVAVVSAIALGWLMWLLLEQDKAVEMQRRQERLEQAADRAAAVMQAALGELDRSENLPAGVVRVTLGPDSLQVKPEYRLLYYPEAPAGADIQSGRFAEAERAEFAQKDLKAAAALYARLAQHASPDVRAGALTRLARVHRKASQFDAALQDYGELLKLGDVAVSTLPAALIAREGRAGIFEETHRAANLHDDAEALAKALRAGAWRITKSQYQFYAAEANAWLRGAAPAADPDAVALAEAVEWLSENRRSIDAAARRVIQTDAGPALIVARATQESVTASIAAPGYLASLCHQAVSDPRLHCTLADGEGRGFAGEPVASRSAAIRTAASVRLPWTLQISSVAAANDVAAQRRLLASAAVVLALVWLTGAMFIIRAISREARVAQLQSDFVAAVSHEFRSPLSSLCQISEMLAAERFESSAMRSHAYGVLQRESERLRRLVEGLLDFQRFEAGAAVYHFERLELGEFIKTIVADFQERIAPAGYTIELRAPEAAAYVSADGEALSRALWNLLDNAVKYSPECRTIWVHVDRTAAGMSIAVRDRGLGIPIAEQREIFEKFVRGADSKARRIKGTGIGLAMVRHIVTAHGGDILVASKPGEGSRFTIVFPKEVLL